jgi:pimeloyl-ACP methyl ester carboxylesterase
VRRGKFARIQREFEQMSDTTPAATPRPPAWFDRALASPGQPGSIEVGGVPITYRVWGEVDRPGVILVHGSNAHLQWWRFVAPFLAERLRVVALDLSGNGDSGWRDRYDGELFADEVFGVGRAAGVGERPVVVGHSFGGYVALETGHKYGRDLAGVMLADFTVSPPETYTEWGMRAEREGKQRRSTRIYAHLGAALQRFRLLPEQPCQHPYIVEFIARQSLREVAGGWTWKFDPALFDHLEMGVGQRDKFAGLACRTALILGEHSTDDGAQSADYMAHLTGGVLPIMTIPGTYHHMMFDEPLAMAAAIAATALAWYAEDNRDAYAAALRRA